MLVALLIRPIVRIIDFIQQPQLEETTEQLQQTPSDNQAPEPSPEMPQGLPNNRPNASGDNSRPAGNPENGRHEGHPRAVSGTTAHRYRGEQRTGRGDQTYSRLRAQNTRLRSLENYHRQLVDEHESLEHSHHQLSEAHQVTVTSLCETQTTCKKQQEEIKTLREKLRGTSALLDVRNQELKVAKTFLSKEDTFSTSDVVQSIRDLNSEIMQTAAHLAENLPLKRVRTPRAEDIPEGLYKSTFVTLVLLQGSGDEVDMGSLELALQGFLAVYACRIANTWGFSPGSSQCAGLYSTVCETEDRAVASNWRALTRRTLSNMDSSKEDLPRQILNAMIKQLAEIISFCGVGELAGNSSNVHQYAAGKLGSLIAAARKLNRMIGENVVSEDLMVTVIPGGRVFDGEQMEDAYARSGTKPDQRAVICTTDLGLCEGKAVKGGKVLVKPKVALRSL